MKNIYDQESFFKAYAHMPRSREGLGGAGEWHQLQPLFPNLQGKKVLDLGCGFGWHCMYAVRMGAESVLGIDSSKRMLERAALENYDGKITYEVCGIEEYGYPRETFDLVISNLVLHYIEDLDQVYADVYKTLKKGGQFLFNIEHPVFTAGVKEDWIYNEAGEILYWPVDHYYDTGKRETLFLGEHVVKQHHTLTQILNSLLKCGFHIEAVEEAVPPENMMHLQGMKEELRRPMMLLVKAGKAGGDFGS